MLKVSRKENGEVVWLRTTHRNTRSSMIAHAESASPYNRYNQIYGKQPRDSGPRTVTLAGSQHDGCAGCAYANQRRKEEKT
jgi:hypothetical protein